MRNRTKIEWTAKAEEMLTNMIAKEADDGSYAAGRLATARRCLAEGLGAAAQVFGAEWPGWHISPCENLEDQEREILSTGELEAIVARVLADNLPPKTAASAADDFASTDPGSGHERGAYQTFVEVAQRQVVDGGAGDVFYVGAHGTHGRAADALASFVGKRADGALRAFT